jgi:hypothetical protein
MRLKGSQLSPPVCALTVLGCAFRCSQGTEGGALGASASCEQPYAGTGSGVTLTGKP